MIIELLYTYDNPIDRVNTYYFSTDKKRDAFFDNSKNVSIDTTFYPPYYRNRIRFDTDDFNIYKKELVKSFKYLRLQYEDEYYYYFIDDIIYINENVYELTVSMDTFMTFMNKFNMHDICIERKFIDRWNDDGTINRNYLRENVSNNSFNKWNETILNSNTNDWIIIGKFSDYPLASTSLDYWNTSYSLQYNNKVKIFNIPEFIGYVPYNSGSFKGTTISQGDMLSTLPNAYITDCYVIPFNPFVKYKLSNGTISDASTVSLLNVSTKSEFINGKEYKHNILYNSSVNTCKINSQEYSFSFYRVAIKNVKFSYLNIPQLIDTNYISITFGDNDTNISYPIYNLSSVKLNFLYWCDLSSGVRYYMITDNDKSYNLENNEYSTIVSNSNVLSFTLRNSAWQTYISRNKATLAGAMIDDTTNAVTTILSSYGRANDISNKEADFFTDMSNWDKRYKKTPMLRKQGVRRLEALSQEADEYNVESLAKGFASGSSQVGNYIKNETNLKYTPASISRFGNAQLSLLGSSPYISYKISYCEDIEQVAQYYHRNGYLVNEWYDKASSFILLYNYINTRYYFNVIKLSNCEIEPNIITLSERLIADLKERLFTGLRLWNTEVTACDYSYDNVERKYL